MASIFKVGDRVTAMFRGSHGWFAGEVTAVVDGGRRYDVLYDDGDRDEGLEAAGVRPPGEPPHGCAHYVIIDPAEKSWRKVETAGSQEEIDTTFVNACVQGDLDHVKNLLGRVRWDQTAARGIEAARAAGQEGVADFLESIEVHTFVVEVRHA